MLAKPGEALAARILEVEAYNQDDPAAHSFRGPTPRNEVMFGPAGFLYVYFTYGMHWCANVVAGPEGRGEAVLLRAAQPLEGLDVMRERRGPKVTERDLLRGPARLAQAFGLDRGDNGTDLCAPDSPVVLRDDGWRPASIATGPRIGIRHAADVPWRFWVEGDPLVTRYVRHRGAG